MLKIQTAQSRAGERHTAELSGWFFPGQVRRLAELLRVALPNFACELAAEPRHATGINAFTQLGMRRIAAVECVCAGTGPDGNAIWKWGFKFGD